MAENIFKITTVHQCNSYLGEKTFHPLASVIRLSGTDLSSYTYLQFGFYSVFLREYAFPDFACGRQRYDYSDGSLLFLPPGKYLNREGEATVCPPEGWMVAFHPDLIKGTSLGSHIRDYTFFSYRVNEALHLSCREKRIATECIQHIRDEVRRDVDNYSKLLIARNIELFLDYCRRFYERQFITRQERNKELLDQLNRVWISYILDNRLKDGGFPTEIYFADRLRLSPAYFRDLLRHETGLTVREYVETKRMETARDWVMRTDKPVGQIADMLGFPSVQCFSRVFKKVTGWSPGEYRMLN